MARKIRLLFIPFVVVSLLFIGSYTFLNWLLTIRYPVLNLQEELTDFWGPAVLACIPVLIWIRPRVKLLSMKSGKGDRSFGYLFVAGLILAVPTVLLQKYLVSATGKLTVLNSVRNIDKKALTKYYEFEHHYTSKENYSTFYNSRVSGKYGQTLDLEIYIACPIFDEDQTPTRISPSPSPVPQQPSDSGIHPLVLLDGNKINYSQLENIPLDSIAKTSVLKGNAALALYGPAAARGVILLTSKGMARVTAAFPSNRIPAVRAWCCVRYGKSISNRLTDQEKKDREHLFYKASLLDYEHKNLDAFSYLMRPGNNGDRAAYQTAISRSGLATAPPDLILEPQYGAFGDRSGKQAAIGLGALAGGLLLWLVMILIPRFREDAEEPAAASKRIFLYDARSAFELFIPKPGRYATTVISDLTIFIFLLMAVSEKKFLSFPPAELLRWGANFRPYVNTGEWYRLLTSIFLHNGIVHLLANLYALVFAGIFLEPVLGRKRFAVYYLITGVIASLCSLYWHEATVSVGASGAIFGLYGILIALMLQKIFGREMNKAFLTSILLFIGYNLLMGQIGGGIDNAAHIGGLLSGFTIGLLIAPSLKQERETAAAVSTGNLSAPDK